MQVLARQSVRRSTRRVWACVEAGDTFVGSPAFGEAGKSGTESVGCPLSACLPMEFLQSLLLERVCST